MHEAHGARNQKSTPHARLTKALCCILDASLNFWKHLTGKLDDWGFELNPCDVCVANKEIDGK